MSMSKLERLLTAVQLKMPDIVPVSPRGTFNRSQVLKRKTLKTISEKASIPFNEVSRKVGVESGSFGMSPRGKRGRDHRH